MFKNIDKTWYSKIKNEIKKPYIKQLESFILNERLKKNIYPKEEDVFNCFLYTPFYKVKIVIIGQDPYFLENQANGLAFSVNKNIKIPNSLKNIYKELKDDLGIPISKNGFLKKWAEQGILLLNTILTVEEKKPRSHVNIGWEDFTNYIIKIISNLDNKTIFVLWGNDSLRKIRYINMKKNIIITSSHPSPLSANKGFFGSRPFSKINMQLKLLKKKEIIWNI